MELQPQLIIQNGVLCGTVGVRLEWATPGDIYLSYVTVAINCITAAKAPQITCSPANAADIVRRTITSLNSPTETLHSTTGRQRRTR